MIKSRWYDLDPKIVYHLLFKQLERGIIFKLPNQEWHEVQVSWQQSRQRYYLQSLKHLVKLGQSHKDVKESQDLKQIFQALESGSQLTVDQIIAIKSLFEKGPLNLRELTPPYARWVPT